jgi:hypothetical protein
MVDGRWWMVDGGCVREKESMHEGNRQKQTQKEAREHMRTGGIQGNHENGLRFKHRTKQKRERRKRRRGNGVESLILSYSNTAMTKDELLVDKILQRLEVGRDSRPRRALVDMLLVKNAAVGTPVHLLPSLFAGAAETDATDESERPSMRAIWSRDSRLAEASRQLPVLGVLDSSHHIYGSHAGGGRVWGDRPEELVVFYVIMTVGRVGRRRKRVPCNEMSSRLAGGSLLFERVSVDRHVDLRGPAHLDHHPRRLRSRCHHHHRLFRNHDAWARANGKPDRIGVKVLGSLSHDSTRKDMQSQLRYT